MWSPTVLPPAWAKKGQQHQQALHLLRAMWRQAIVPDVVTGLWAEEFEQRTHSSKIG